MTSPVRDIATGASFITCNDYEVRLRRQDFSWLRDEQQQMTVYQLQTHYEKIIADRLTPVSIYLKIRDRFQNSILLESSDFHAPDNSFSYICCNAIASIEVKDEIINKKFPDGKVEVQPVDQQTDVVDHIHDFTKRFGLDFKDDFKFISNGIFGYMGYDAVRYFEDIHIRKKADSIDIPEIFYAVYQNIIVIDHFKDEAYVFAHCYNQPSNLEWLLRIIQGKESAAYGFKAEGKIDSNLSDEAYLDHVRSGKEHCARGDVFQLVLSRRFEQSFSGDEFNVYRALRSINPSPYLFYFDYGNFKIYGSSPEAQLIIKDGQAEIHPIAGTFRRTGDGIEDGRLAEKLLNDDKENSEHVMLVDLARNDLSRHGSKVKVDTFKEVQFFSHVIHLVSKVIASKHPETNSMQVVADTFPAGTLSGAPKHRAMQLIDQYEKTNRSFYGGAIGYMGFNGNFNHAIMIRTFLSKDFKLYWQAGAGIVFKSNPQSELQEVNNKLAALTKAIERAEAL